MHIVTDFRARVRDDIYKEFFAFFSMILRHSFVYLPFQFPSTSESHTHIFLRNLSFKSAFQRKLSVLSSHGEMRIFGMSVSRL